MLLPHQPLKEELVQIRPADHEAYDSKQQRQFVPKEISSITQRQAIGKMVDTYSKGYRHIEILGQPLCI